MRTVCQKGVDGRSQWGTGTRETEVRMDGMQVALGNRGMKVEAAQQCAKDRKEWRALVHMYLNEFHAAIFAWHCSFGPPSRALVVIAWRGEGCHYMMRLG